MKKLLALSSLSVVLLLGGCKTVSGLGDAASNLFGNDYYDGFEGKFVDVSKLNDYKDLEDKYTGTGTALSYSGNEVPAHHVRINNIVESPKLNAYFQKMTDDIISHWPGTPVKAKVHIIDSFAFAPSVDSWGNIYIPISMLVNIESEDEAVTLMAHEISHLLLRHHERTAAFDEQRKTINTIASGVVAANVAKDTKVVKRGNKYDLDYQPSKHGSKNITKAAVYSGLINSISDNVWSTAWGRTQENEADLLGMDLAIAMGYSPRASRDTLERLANFQGQQESLLDSFWGEQKKVLTSAIEDMNVNGFTEGLNNTVEQGLGTLIASAGQWFKESHMSPEKRDIQLRKYATREYDDKIRQRVKKKQWRKFINQPEILEVIKGYRVTYQVNQLLSEQKISEANQVAKQLTRLSINRQPGIRDVMYNLRRSQGNLDKAYQNLELVRGWENASRGMYTKMIEYLITKKDFDRAMKYIVQAEGVFKSEELFIYEKAMVYFQLDQHDEGVAALKQCANYENSKEMCKTYLQQLNA